MKFDWKTSKCWRTGVYTGPSNNRWAPLDRLNRVAIPGSQHFHPVISSWNNQLGDNPLSFWSWMVVSPWFYHYHLSYTSYSKKTRKTTQDPLSNFMSYLICHRKFVSIIMLKPFGHGLGPGEASSAPTWCSLALFGNWIDSNYMFYCRYTHRIHVW